MIKNKIPANVKLFGILKETEGWTCVTVKMDTTGKVEFVEMTPHDIKASAVENVKIKLGRQFIVEDGVYK
jgi:hypothetical protein